MEEEYRISKLHVVLQNMIKEIKERIAKELYKHNKVTLTMYIVYEKDCDVKIIPISNTFNISENKYIDQCLHDAVEKLMRDVDMYKGTGSEWFIKQLYYMDIYIMRNK